MSKRRFQSVEFKKVDWCEIVRRRDGERIVLAVDVAKEDFVATLLEGGQRAVVTFKWRHPQDAAEVVACMAGLGQGRRLEAVLEPGGTYGDVLAWQLRQAGIALYRVSPKRVHDAAEVYDGVPSDTRFRERLDEIDPRKLRPLYKALLARLQRGKGLEGFTYLDDHYLLSLDGTGYFSSQKVHCAQCAEKHHRNGTTTYYHRMLGAVLVHPDHTEVFPLAPEPILKPDGAKKNDCERNAAKRLLSELRREHPHLKLIVVEDALASNAPHIRHLQALDLRFILGAKQSDHKLLFEWVEATAQTAEASFSDAKGFRHRFRYLNGAPLNDANFDLEVNFLEYREHAPDGTVTHFARVTDIPIDDSNLMTLMRGARARWKIENETFNTLKNQGYHFEHNFGHGNQHLSTVLMHLMLLAFLIDQIQQRCCRLFQAALSAARSKARLWRKLRGRFDLCPIPDWEALYLSIIAPPQIALGGNDTS